MKSTEQLYTEYEYLVSSTINRNFSSEAYRSSHILDLDDIYQFGRIGLYEACLEYDETKGKTFRNFAIERIIWKIQDESKINSLRNANNYSNELVDSVSLDATSANEDDEEMSMYDTIASFDNELEDYKTQQYLKTVEQTTSKQVANIVKLRLEGYTFADIANILNVSRQYASRLLNENKDRIKSIVVS